MLVLIMAGCDSFFNDREEERFDPREHPLIEKSDTLIFMGTQNVDSFYVWESQFYKSRERNYDEDYEHYVGRMDLMNYNDTIIRFDIAILNFWYSFSYFLQFKTESGSQFVGNQISKKNKVHKMQIGSIELSDVYEVNFKKQLEELTKDEYSHLFIAVDNTYYSKTYGLVKYIKYTGEEFVLSEESLEMLMARE
jgi:hypothetical protein